MNQPQPIQPQPIQQQPIQQQRPDPYAQANPYGLPAVQERPYVPMQRTTLPAVPMNQVHYASNNAAIGSVVVGALAFCLSIVGVIPGAPFFYYSAGGILAIIGGARALYRRSKGYATVMWAPVTAIILGSLAVVLMIAGFAIHLTAATAFDDGSQNTQSQSATGAQSDSGSQSGSVSEAMPQAPTFSTDAALTQYEQSASQIATAIYATYNGGQVSTTTPQWPSSLSELSNGTVTFPSGTAAATIPTDEIVKYTVSSDGKYFDVYVSGGPKNEIAIYDSEANELTWLCDTGAASTCPTGGISPSSGSGSGATSNS
jgi:hypothetical protein